MSLDLDGNSRRIILGLLLTLLIWLIFILGQELWETWAEVTVLRGESEELRADVQLAEFERDAYLFELEETERIARNTSYEASVCTPYVIPVTLIECLETSLRPSSVSDSYDWGFAFSRRAVLLTDLSPRRYQPDRPTWPRPVVIDEIDEDVQYTESQQLRDSPIVPCRYTLAETALAEWDRVLGRALHAEVQVCQ
jgi:hypothetical protein